MKFDKIAIYGTGAVGSYFWWGLRDKFGDNLWVVAAGERKERLLNEGLIINGVNYIPKVLEPDQSKEADLIIVATKYEAYKENLEEIAGIAGSDGVLLIPLNGVDSEELILKYVSDKQIIHSMIQIASQRKGNEINFVPEKTPGVFVGIPGVEMLEKDQRLLALADAFKDTGVKYNFCDNILQEIWKKMAFNVSYNLPQAIVGCGVGAFAESDYLKNLRFGLRKEVELVAAALGIDISEMSAIEKMTCPSPVKARYSTLQDLDNGRHTEVDMFAGAIMRLGKKHNIPTPYAEFSYNVIKALEEKNDGLYP